MTVCHYPVARIQDLIDRLKSLTKPIGEANGRDINEAWNELEDLIIMTCTRSSSLEVKRKSDTLTAIIEIIDEYLDTEITDAGFDKESRGIDRHRRSHRGDSSGNKRRTGTIGDHSTETNQGSPEGITGSE